MQLTVKTLKGSKFQVDAEPSNTIAQVKGLIEASKSDLPAAGMKLIHSGKVLKDDDTIEKCNIKPNDFLVVMISKAKKPAATPAPPVPPATADTPPASAPAPPATADAPPAPAPAETPAATTSAAPAAAPPAPSRPSTDDFPPEMIANLTALGFPEAEVKHCLRAANGNPDVAVEFLTNGIPPGISAAAGASPRAAPAPGGQPLQALRAHPQFDALRRLVQSNPQMLQQVLTQIGQQQPELLQEINANQALFLEMMNEPVSDAPAPAAPAPGGAPPGGGDAASLLQGLGDPAQMAQMLQSMNPEELNQMAAMMGLTPQQLQATAQMIGQIPPDQLQQFMAQAMQAEGMGGAPGGQQVLRLTEEEMAAVDRLTEMGFDRTEAAQAFLACDKNEALAANLLMDSAGQDGGAFGFDDPPPGGDGGGNNDDDNMYD